MKILNQTVTEQVEVAYLATDDDGDYPHTETLIVAGKLPTVAKARATWDAARLEEMTAQHAAWKAAMTAPTVKPTKADLERELARAHSDKVAAEAKIATLTAAVAAADAVAIVEDAKVG